ncbi:16S rRNA (guanine(527)-N(7))-methyltransferase RsmG [Puniceibacterium confluentis]|uniref:16S rRNA (guanine(527)-N(7))-methyltransferase RsmG n=1 Tax=Puniceibacterium confluentis TaxID=1958944 RepID=UPI0011B39326|nr:16S rRNA (guanine(527)-N(7))-methyltransferase RsmG [Puniceibacterium confluentis]
MTPTSADAALGDVSRETVATLEKYVALLLKWNRRINLVSQSTLKDVWTRHVQDSLQLYDLAPEKTAHWVDLGSGGGFPGLVIAILSREKDPQRRVTLVESDQRKSTFLRQVLRETGVKATVLSERIEVVPPLSATILSARALTDLEGLCGYAHRHLGKDGTALFPKGATWKNELGAARNAWSFSLVEHTSQTDPNAVILQIGELANV